MTKVNKFALLALTLLTAISCSSDKASINGKFAGVKNSKIIIEEMTPNRIKFIDSTRTSKDGSFDFSYKFKDNTPVFLRVRNNNDFIILIAHPNDKIELSSMLNLSANYIVKGSPDSEKIKELNSRLSKSAKKISDLTQKLNVASSDNERELISMQISDLYIKQKQANIAFIVTNSKSLASIVSLYQVFPNGISIFGDNKDFNYFRLLSDSLSNVYPQSPFVTSLSETVAKFENIKEMNNIISDAVINNISIGYPDITLPDTNGTERSLSELDGKVIILAMVNPYQKNSQFVASELRKVYDVYAQKGLAIYQVSIDNNVANWQMSMRNQKLPWVNVVDNRGAETPLINTYNLQGFPALYLIDRGGDIVGKNIWGNDLIKRVGELLK